MRIACRLFPEKFLRGCPVHDRKLVVPLHASFLSGAFFFNPFSAGSPFKDGSVFRASYVYTHGENLDQNYQINDPPSAYTWQVRTGTTGNNAGAR